MHLSVFFRGHYAWLDHRAQELLQHLSVDLLNLFVHQATLVLACEREILRPGLLTALLSPVPPELHARLCDDESRVNLERRLLRLSRASSVAAFRFELGLLRDGLALAGRRAESWALFAETVLLPAELFRLEAIIGRCYDRCSALAPSPEHALRVDVLH